MRCGVTIGVNRRKSCVWFKINSKWRCWQWDRKCVRTKGNYFILQYSSNVYVYIYPNIIENVTVKVTKTIKKKQYLQTNIVVRSQ